MEFIDRLVDGSLMPHGQCLLWRPDLLFLHVGGDVLTVGAYFAIPPAFLILRRHRRDLALDKIMLLFAAFIFLCGVTHLLGMINIWHGYYFVEGLTKLSTGLVSAFTAIMVWLLIPEALKIPSIGALITNQEVLQRSHDEIELAKAELAALQVQIEQKKEQLKSQ